MDRPTEAPRTPLRPRSRPRRPGLAVAGLAVALVAAPAFGSNPIANMDDLDQMRTGLAMDGNGVPGGMFCVPTATMNAFYFLYQHGFSLIPFPAGAYDALLGTQNIAFLGSLMGTDGVKGTTGGMIPGIVNYLDFMYLLGGPGGAWDSTMVLDYWFGDGTTITAKKMKAWLNFSGVVMLNWGRFDATGKRTGGHETTLVGIASDGMGGYTVSHADPAADENPRDLDVQSTFTVGTVPVAPTPGMYSGKQATLLHSLNQGSTAAIDGFTVLRPLFMFSNYNAIVPQVAIQSPKIDQIGGLLKLDALLPEGRGIADLALDPTEPTGFVLPAGATTIYSVDLTDGTVTPFVKLTAPRRMLFAGMTEMLYVVDGNGISVVHPTGKRLYGTTTRAPIDAFAWDPVGQRIVAASRGGNALYFYDSGLHLTATAPLPPLDGTGALRVSIDGRSGQIWLHADGSRTVTAAQLGRDGTWTYTRVALQTTGLPTGLHVDEHGLIYASEEGVLREYDTTGTPTRHTGFAGLAAGAVFTMPRTNSNYDETVFGPRDSPLADWNAIAP